MTRMMEIQRHHCLVFVNRMGMGLHRQPVYFERFVQPLAIQTHHIMRTFIFYNHELGVSLSQISSEEL